MNKIFKFLICCGVVFLVACDGGNSAPGILKDYLKRVETATGIASEPAPQTALLTYPSRRDRVLPVEEIRVGLLGFLNFMECDFFTLINERNSIMGRVMPVSKRLVYEVEFLQGAKRCYSRLDEAGKADESFSRDMERILQVKRDNLAKIFWNATFDSPEMQKAFSLAVSPLGLDEDAAYTNSRQAIEYFNGVGARLKDPDLAIDISELEAQYFALQLHQYGGRLLQSVSLLTGYLNKAAYSLERLIENRPLCYQGRPIQKARILETVFGKYYSGRVAPYLSQVHRQGREWFDAVNHLIAIQEVPLPPAFEDYHQTMLAMDNEKGLWHEFEEAIHRHTRAWQELLGQCGLMPGRDL